VSSEPKPLKSWIKLLEAGKKMTFHKQEEESILYPLRRTFRPAAPDITKGSLKRDFEQGLVYYVGTKSRMTGQPAVSIAAPTGRIYPDAVAKKRAILEEQASSRRPSTTRRRGLLITERDWWYPWLSLNQI